MSFISKVNEVNAASKTAKVSVVSIEVTCPCGGEIASPDTGSLNWEINADIPPSVVCNECGETLKIPIAKINTLRKVK